MKVLLTGITGNLGHEVAEDLILRGVEVIPCVRAVKAPGLRERFPELVECDLLENNIEFSGQVDSIIHCAGVVHFRDVGNKNEQMMERVVDLAKKLSVPIYYASTAFVYRPSPNPSNFNNAYEADKYRAEQLLSKSGIAHGILRPSVLTGHSRTGEIQNFNGFYLIVRAFIAAAQSAKSNGRILRFPRMAGESNMIPVDQAAKSICDAVTTNRLETLFVTNPEPPHSAWVLEETLDFFNVRNSVKMEDVSFDEFGELDLTEEESSLYRFSKHFSPYWSMEYAFPPSVCGENLIDHGYMTRALTFFQDSENFHGKRTH